VNQDAGHDQRDLRQAIADMSQRLRYGAGEYRSPLPPVPLPPWGDRRHPVSGGRGM